MKNSKKVLIVVTTEFGLLTALLYYLANLNKKYYPYFVLLQNNKERFQGLNLNFLPGQHEIFVDELGRNIWNPDKTFLVILKEQSVQEIVFQNPLNFITNIIINTYKHEDPSICLTALSDGLLISTGISAKNKLILTLRLLHRKYINQFKNLPFFVKHYKNIVSDIDLLIAHEDIGAKKFLNSNEVLAEIKNYPTILNNVFSMNIQRFVEADIIFFTQPILSNRFPREVKENYIKLLRNIALFMQNNNIRMLFKVHPEEDVDLYKQFENDHVFVGNNKNVPSEIILHGLKNKVILSMFSSVSLNNHEKSLKHFWLYKLINYELKIKNALSDIEIPSSLNELNHLIFEIYKTNSFNLNKVGKTI